MRVRSKGNLWVAVFWIAVVASVLGLATPSAAQDDSELVATTAEYQYRFDPDAGEVQVTVAITANVGFPSPTDGFTELYRQGVLLAVPVDIEDLAVTDSGGRSLSYRVDTEQAGFHVLVIDFASRIYSGQSEDVVVGYTMVDRGPRSDVSHRINAAHLALEVWTDSYLDEATVTIIAPRRFVDLSYRFAFFDQETVDGERRFTFVTDDPESFGFRLELTDLSALVSTRVEVGGHNIEILAWPGDEEWSDNVQDILEKGLPELIDAVGLPLPPDRDLIIREAAPIVSADSADVALEPEHNLIVLGDDLDPHLLFREISQAWFNFDLFKTHWVTHGLADEFASEAVASLGGPRPDPDPVSPLDIPARPLVDWSGAFEEYATEMWSRDASWVLTRSLADEVGSAVLSEVVQAAAANEIAYLGDGPAEDGPGRLDWKLYLDLLENRGQVTDTAIVDLFVAWALNTQHETQVAIRADSRGRYHRLAADGDEWAPPLGVRKAMSAWRFPEADELMAQATEMLQRRDEARRAADDLGVQLPAHLEEVYEAADDNYETVGAELDDVAVLLAKLTTVTSRLENENGVVGRIGRFGADPAADVATALARFEAGDLSASSELVDRVEQDLDGLGRAGVVRFGAAIGALIAISGLVVLMIRRRRRTRTPAAPAFPAT